MDKVTNIFDHSVNKEYKMDITMCPYVKYCESERCD